MNKVKKIFFFISKKNCGARLDVLISSKINNISRSKIKFLILSGCIFVNHIKRRPSYIVEKKELIFINIKKKIRRKLTNIKKTSLKILYEDSDIIIINKENDSVIHSSYKQKYNILINQIININPNFKNIFSKTNRPGVIHRLDKETSGIIIIAKSTHTLSNISNQFRKRSIIKKYITIVYNLPIKNNDLINLPIGRHSKNRKIMSVKTNKPKKAITYWKVAEKYKNIASLLEINIRTGRTHQIRVHCKEIGHNIIGDKIYNSKNKRYIKTTTLANSKQMLHASKIYLEHPTSKKTVMFETRIPKRFIKFIKKTKSKEKKF